MYDSVTDKTGCRKQEMSYSAWIRFPLGDLQVDPYFEYVIFLARVQTFNPNFFTCCNSNVSTGFG